MFATTALMRPCDRGFHADLHEVPMPMQRLDAPRKVARVSAWRLKAARRLARAASAAFAGQTKRRNVRTHEPNLEISVWAPVDVCLWTPFVSVTISCATRWNKPFDELGHAGVPGEPRRRHREQWRWREGADRRTTKTR